MKKGFLRKTISSLIVSIFLTYVLITTNDLLTRVVVVPFLMFVISLFIRNICLILKKERIANVFRVINVVLFFIYYFGFLVFWDYMAIVNKEWALVVFSLVAWLGGIFALCRRKSTKNS